MKNNKCKEFPNQVWNGTFFTNGFTLIELLVVVLIIGILAAVAFPQYKKAVEKTRFANYLTMANSLVSSVRVSYMANGSWPTTFDELAVNLPADMTTGNTITNGVCRKNSKNFCCLSFPTVDFAGGFVFCGDNDYNLAVAKRFADTDGTSDDATSTRCYAKNKKEPYVSVCKSIGDNAFGRGTGSLATPNGWTGGYSYYLLD